MQRQRQLWCLERTARSPVEVAGGESEAGARWARGWGSGAGSCRTPVQARSLDLTLFWGRVLIRNVT